MYMDSRTLAYINGFGESQKDSRQKTRHKPGDENENYWFSSCCGEGNIAFGILSRVRHAHSRFPCHLFIPFALTFAST